MMRTNDQRLTNLYESVVFCNQHRLMWFCVPQSHRWVVSTGRNGCRLTFLQYLMIIIDLLIIIFI